MEKREVNYKVTMILCISLFFVLFIYCAKNMLSENPAGGNFYNWENNILSLLWIPLMLIYLFIALSDNRRKDFLGYFIVFTILLYGIPLIAYSVCIKTCLTQIVHVNLFLVVLLFLQKYEFCIGDKQIFDRKYELKFNRDRISYQKKIVAILLIIAITIGLYIYINGFNISLSLASLYSTRASYKDKANFLITSIKESFSWFLIPILIMRGINKRKYVFTLLMIFLEILLFALAKDKIILLILATAIGMSFIKKYDIRRMALLVIVSINGIFLVSMVISVITKSNFFYELLPRRLFVTPSNVADYYYRYFAENEKLLWRQDVFFIDKFFTDVYETSYTQLIVNQYLYGLDTNPCTGVIAESYVQFGAFGAIVYGIILKGLTRGIENVACSINKKELVFIFFSFSYMLVDSAMTSTSFVLDMIILMLFIRFVPDYNEEVDINECFDHF